jgi:cysteinyl-tRNA synthetase
LRTALEFLGFSGDRANVVRTASAAGEAQLSVSAEAVGERIEARNAARKAKNFAEADRIRGELEAMGVTLKDAKDPKTGELVTTWEVAR